MIRLTELVRLPVALAAIAAAGQDATSQFPLDDTHFSPFGGHPHFILNPGHRLVLEGQADGDQIVLTVTALNQTKAITLPSRGSLRTILARVVEEREVVDGALAEVARYWYARSIETGDIYFFGEEVDFYSDGSMVGQTRLWEAGVDGALPGIVMPGTFLLGARYYQNQAVDARDRAENIALGLTVSVPAGTFTNCIQILERDTLKPETGSAGKTYAPGIGLINDDDQLLLTSVELGTQGLPAGCSFSPSSNNPLLPLIPGRQLLLEGIENGHTNVLSITVMNEIRTLSLTIADEAVRVPARIVEERTTVDGRLQEISRSLVAQCLETGDVLLLGRERDHYENGVIIDHEGSWLTGVDGAAAGILMPSHFAVGTRYVRGSAPGFGDDVAVSIGSDLIVTVPAGKFSGCVRIRVTSPVGPDPTPSEMIYAPGVGLISDRGTLRLTSFTAPDLASGAPIISVNDALLLTWPLTDQLFRLESSPDLQAWSPVLQVPVTSDGRHQVSVPRGGAQNFFRLTTR